MSDIEAKKKRAPPTEEQKAKMKAGREAAAQFEREQKELGIETPKAKKKAEKRKAKLLRELKVKERKLKRAEDKLEKEEERREKVLLRVAKRSIREGSFF